MFFNDLFSQKTDMPSATDALPGREDAIPTAETHFVSGLPLKGTLPDNLEIAYFGKSRAFISPPLAMQVVSRQTRHIMKQ
jgi:hypothetical protein